MKQISCAGYRSGPCACVHLPSRDRLRLDTVFDGFKKCLNLINASAYFGQTFVGDLCIVSIISVTAFYLDANELPMEIYLVWGRRSAVIISPAIIHTAYAGEYDHILSTKSHIGPQL